MQTTWDLTAAEARAVTNLWRLRTKLPIEDHSAIATNELSQLLGASVDELSKLGRKARRVLPSSMVASDARLSWQEAETVLALHAARGTINAERLPLSAIAGALGVDEESLYPVIRDARERLAAAEAIARAPNGNMRTLDSTGTAVGENPFGWQIMWGVIGVIAVALAMLMVVWRR
jgi:hypothetical protein